MKDTGKKTSSMVRARKHGLMGLAMRVITWKAKRMVLANSNGLTVLLMKVSS
jgi:hypothetical protein